MTDRRPNMFDVGRGRHLVLPLPVVAEGSRLDDSRSANAGYRIPELVKGGGAPEGRRGKTTIGEKLLLAGTLLRGLQRHAAWPHRRDGFNGVDGDERHVFELEGDDVDLTRERSQRVEILVLGDDLDVGDLARRCIDFGRKRVDAVPHAT